MPRVQRREARTPSLPDFRNGCYSVIFKGRNDLGLGWAKSYSNAWNRCLPNMCPLHRDRRWFRSHRRANIIRARPCHLMKWNPCWVLPQPFIKQIPNRLSQTVRDVTKTPGHTTGWYAQGSFPHSLGTPVTWGSWAGTSLESLLSCLKGQFRKSHFGIDCGCLPNYSRLLCLHTKQTNVYWNPFDFPYGHLDYTWPQPSSTVYQDLEFSTHKTLPSTPVRQSITIRNVCILTLCSGYPRMESVPHLLHMSRCRERSQSVSTGGWWAGKRRTGPRCLWPQCTWSRQREWWWHGIFHTGSLALPVLAHFKQHSQVWQ